VWFVIDQSSGEPQVPVVTGLAALVALALSVTPAAARWVASRGGERPVTARPGRAATVWPGRAISAMRARGRTGEPDADRSLTAEPLSRQG